MHSGIDSQPWAFEETTSKGRKKMRNRENLTFWAMGTKRALVPRWQNRGINSSPGLQNNTIKRGEGLQREDREKFTTESLRKFCREKKLREISKPSPGIPKTATIAHIRIQKDSNFASLKGLNSHLSL